MFSKVLIANRGAIATRIIRTLKKLNISSVAVYNEADCDSLHVSEAEEAFSLGVGTATQTYLNQDLLFDIARESGVQAIHPGYGFLSENPEFVQRCEAEGIIFLGPTAEQMQTFGLKHSARALAEANQVPLLPGTELLSSVHQAVEAAAAIQYPVMLKSTAGGGGIGMQLCYDEQQLRESYESVIRLGENNFSNGGVFLEKFVEHARHIEVQVFGDGCGEVLTLMERDCSSQRRNQKVVEETPAPNLPNFVREQLQAVAHRLMSAVNYRSAGTVEFVYDVKEETFYFLEVNTRLQVEHGITEAIYGIDLVEWMLWLGCNQLPPLKELATNLTPNGHAVQVRIYAEDPNKTFQPSAGLLSQVDFPKQSHAVRIDHWIEAGVEVPSLFDPMLAKIIVSGSERSQALSKLKQTLAETHLYGIETNLAYLQSVLATHEFCEGLVTTRLLNDLSCPALTVDVISPGTMTTIQDYPGRIGFWDVGVPPSGPFDSFSFRLGNRLLKNSEQAAGLELTLTGPTLKFNTATRILLAGAQMPAQVNEKEIAFWEIIELKAGDILSIGKAKGSGARAYLLIQDGFDCPLYMGSKSTFTLGQFGGHAGRAIKTGDVLHLNVNSGVREYAQLTSFLPSSLIPRICSHWEVKVIYGPHGAPDFFTTQDIDTFFSTDWEVHYNSSRTGVRLIGPKPEWARTDGGEAGMHPSNIHDNAYAIGAIDFTGDMPVILGPDGPSLGGFVCPATIIQAELWKIGQFKAGDTIRFIPVSIADAVNLEQAFERSIEQLVPQNVIWQTLAPKSRILKHTIQGIEVAYRASGDRYLLVEYGDQALSIAMRFRVHALMLHLQDMQREGTLKGLLELTPGIRSLQVHYDSQKIQLSELLDSLEQAEASLADYETLEVPARIVHLPLSWDDESCHFAVEKYMQSVRKDAPWCPNNIEFIRRINGLDSIDQVKQIVFDASYLVMGLGDVYLGAPVATPLNPCHRLVTTKYNPARTWTAENSVGIGGSYLCVYGMEGPGGYQFVGRTLQMWNRYRRTEAFTQPWLLRFFDQIRFYEVTGEELAQIRKQFPKGQYPLKVEQTTFSLAKYQQTLDDHKEKIEAFTEKRQLAFANELKHWVESGQMNFDSDPGQPGDSEKTAEMLSDHQVAVESHLAGSIWKLLVEVGEDVRQGMPMFIIESMKMEVEVIAPCAGRVSRISCTEGSQVAAGQILLVLDTE